MVRHFAKDVAAGWGETQQRCRNLLQREESLREVAEIVGLEGMQEQDRLILHSAERIRLDFLCQNAYSDDAFTPPQRTLEIMEAILADHARIEQLLSTGVALEEALGNEGVKDAAQ
jgi:V/A-type H+-transporting ATPase subunit A